MKYLYLLPFIVYLSGCISSTKQIATPTVVDDFNARMTEVGNDEYFSIFNQPLTEEQRQALQVLYAYMPLPDITDYSGDFFLKNVDASLKARQEMPWGKDVPDREFRHFVLPLRVNNEMLDSSRIVFYEELKDRVKGLSMEDAILEVNHWCHEKATYQPSDSRTHNPLATVCSAIGRCGEESTFTVAALRSVGIPARQIYTPRWAHTDDNHAWVEVWANGKWYFLGACEPEAVLNLAWFNAPASRGMLMSTRVFGKYDGPEEVLLQLDKSTDINTTEIYAPIDTLNVTVIDSVGNPVSNANVSYRLYNYAEFYPIVTKICDVNGNSSLTSGLGDLIIWATDGKNYGLTKASVGKDKHTEVRLNMNSDFHNSFDFIIVPPAPSTKTIEVSTEATALNDIRKATEDSIRTAYMATFMSDKQIDDFAKKLNVDESRLLAIMHDARGNHATLKQFLSDIDQKDIERAMSFLETLSAKDRSDVTLEILTDHFYGCDSDDIEYVMNPRITDEYLTPYRSYFKNVIHENASNEYRNNPNKWVQWVSDSVDIVEDWTPTTLKMSPTAVWNLRKTNELSRNHFFVASARSMGIPARIDPVTDKTQWRDDNGVWHDAIFNLDMNTNHATKQGILNLKYTPVKQLDNPKYYVNFTISKIENGQPKLLNYPEEATWKSDFKNGIKLDVGQYMLVTGQRMADGSVLSHTDFFKIEENAPTTLDLNIRQSTDGVQVIGSFNSENIYHDINSNTDKSILSTTGRGYYVLGLISPNHEPTNHTLRDIAKLNPEFEKWGKSIVLLFKNENEASRFDASQLPELPSTVTFGTDINGTIEAEIIESMKLPSDDKPIFIIADTFNRVVYVIQGYTIGLGDKLIETIQKLKE